MKSIALTTLLIFLLFAAPSLALIEQTNNYVATNTDQAVFKDAVVLGDNMYVLMTSAVYRFNLTTSAFTKVFDMGFSYLGASLIYDSQDDVFYVAAFKVYKATWGDGGTNPNEPVPTCPLSTDTDYNATNFTVFKLTHTFDVIDSVEYNITLHEGYYYQLYRAMKLVWTGNKLLAYISGEDVHTATAAVYEVSFTSGFTKVLDFTDKIRDMSYYNGTLYVLTLSEVYAYDVSNYALKGTYTKDSWHLQLNGVVADDKGVYVAGYASVSTNESGGVVLVLTHDLASLQYYHMFDVSYAFMAIDVYNHTTFVSYGPDLYSVDWENNTLVRHYTVNYHYAYDMKTESVIDISSYLQRAERVIAFENKSGDLKLFWGGYYKNGEDGNSYAYFAGTDLPRTWITEIESAQRYGGAGYIISQASSNLYLIAGVALGAILGVVAVKNLRKRRRRR